MVDTEHVLEHMRAANPAPSLEQLAADDLELVRDIVARERSATTTPLQEQPQTRPDPLGRRWRIRPVLVAGLAFVLVLGTLGVGLLLFRDVDETATADFTCPPGSTPDQPGPTNQPRPQWEDGFGYATFDPDSGQGLILNSLGGSFWMFDVCTNTWAAAPHPEGIGWVTDFVHDVDSDRAIAFATEDDEVAQIWAYEPNGQGWTRKNDFTVDPTSYGGEPVFAVNFQAVYDPVTGLVVVRSEFTSRMWTYDVETDTWTEIDQGANPPPATEDGQLLTYDASVDRLILYVIIDEGYGHPPTSSTWEFDIRAGRWEKQETNPPEIGFGWWPSGEEFAYDEANQVSVLFSSGTLAVYDASEHRWTVLQGGSSDPNAPAGQAIRLYSAMTYDPVNERILVIGGSAQRGNADVCDRDDLSDGFWCDADDVIAFDVATRRWITLLEPTTS